DPTGRGLDIGIFRGGGGQYSHMAGTLAGVALESGANGVLVGAGAQSAASPELPLKFYLPASAFNPPDSGALPQPSVAVLVDPRHLGRVRRAGVGVRAISANQHERTATGIWRMRRRPGREAAAESVPAKPAAGGKMEQQKAEANSTGGPVRKRQN
ncbi:hypothetical protein, partial [Nocardia sp. FDAARGOS_372]|uniref:hypothetical protein n=1 Tax=Nocardia sp. FDAARGOS_372 TaxID=2018066 RepID=UPI001C12AA88